MTLPHHHLERFSRLYTDEFGHAFTEAEARVVAVRLARFCWAIYGNSQVVTITFES